MSVASSGLNKGLQAAKVKGAHADQSAWPGLLGLSGALSVAVEIIAVTDRVGANRHVERWLQDSYIIFESAGVLS